MKLNLNVLASFFSITCANSMADSIRPTRVRSPITFASNLSIEVVSDSSCRFC